MPLPEPLRRHYPWTPKRIPTRSGTLSVLDVGTGDPLVFVHGNPTWSFYWRTLVGPLSATHRCIAVDHLGCGLSDPQAAPARLADHAERLVDVLDALNLAGATLVCHDWGGPIGTLAAMARPDLFRRLVYFNTALFHGPVPFEIRTCRWPVLGPLMVRGLNGFVRVGQRRAIAHRDRMGDGVGEGYLFPWSSWERRAAVQAFVDDIPLEADHPTRATIDDLDARFPAFAASRPTLLIWGMQDFCFTPAFLDQMKVRAPHAEVAALPDAAHYVVEDAHEQIVPRLTNWLATT